MLTEGYKKHAKERLEVYYDNVDRLIHSIAMQATSNSETCQDFEDQVEHFAGMELLPDGLNDFVTADRIYHHIKALAYDLAITMEPGG